MIIFVSWPAVPGDDVINKRTGEIKQKVNKVHPNGAILMDEDPYEFQPYYWEMDEYYVMLTIHENETPLDAIQQFRQILLI